MDNKTKILLKIVKTWNLSEKPEYRGFRCAYCQKYLHKAFYYWLDGAGYKTPVHFCKKCQKDFESGKIRITKKALPINRKIFGLKFDENFIQICKNIIKNWNTKAKPVYKIFTCDYCGKNMYNSYQTWLNIDVSLVEMHICKNCWNKLSKL
jgi:transcription elongation factor Elf1